MTRHNHAPQPEYALTQDYRYDYEGLWQHPAVCRIRVYERSNNAPVVIASELPENPGTSITNMCEFLAAEVIAKHLPAVFESTDPEPVIWIEQYPRDPHNTKLPEFTKATFTNYTPHVEWLGRSKRLRIGQPQWSHLEREQVEQLVGPIDPVDTEGESI